MPTLRPRDWQEADPPPTNGQVLAMLGIPALAALGVVFVLVLQWLGEL